MRTMPWTRAGLPSAPANQQPDSSIHSTGCDVLARTPYSIRYGTPSPRSSADELFSASVRIERTGSINFANSPPVESEPAGMSGNTEAR